MAEDYGVSLKITADTSDLEKVPKVVEASKREIEKPVTVAPVKVPVEAPQPVKVPVEAPQPVKVPVEQPAPVKVPVEAPQPVKVPVEQPAPIKIEAKADKIRIEVDDAEAKKRIEALTEKDGIKRIRIVTEGGELAARNDGKEIFEIEVDAERAKKTIADLKADARIKVMADTSPADRSISAFFSSVKKGVAAVRSSIATVFAAFGMVSFAVMGVETLINGFKKLREKLTETSRAIAQMRWDSWVGGFNAAADAIIGRHQKILALLKEEQDVTNKASSLRTMETSQNRAQEDQARHQVRQAAIAGTNDPRKIARLQDQFAEEDEQIARKRFEEDKRNRLRQLDDEESIFRSKENGARAALPKLDEEIKNQENIVSIARKSIANGGDREKNEKYIEDAKKRIESLKAEKKSVEELIETMKREADYRQAQQKIVEQSEAPAPGNAAARKAKLAALDQADRDDQADFDRQRSRSAADADFDDRMRASKRISSDTSNSKATRDAAENDQLEMLRQRKQDADDEVAEAEKILAEEMKKDAADRDEKRMARARDDIRNAEATSRDAQRQGEDLEEQIRARKKNEVESYFGGLAEQIEASRPKNRLTEMGLGSGVSYDNSVQRDQANNVKQLVSLARRMSSALDKIGSHGGTATYAP